ncbi:unnamed protein product [Meloidogyne enterolobii]|uniref:Uncharacterized protein n=1 Tax=Meloidogyne enterolobii TaxID=390850 RepID=A0ACB1B3X2_MELEN
MEPSKVEKASNLVKEVKTSVSTDFNIKKTIKVEIAKKSFELDLERENDFELPMNLFEDDKDFKLVDELKNSVPTNLLKKVIKKESKKENSELIFEKEADFDLPMNLFEEEEKNKFEEEGDFFEKEQGESEIIEDIGVGNIVQWPEEKEPVEKDFEKLKKEKANELGRMKIDSEFHNQQNSFDIKRKNFDNFEKDSRPSIEENFKEKKKEKASDLGRMKIVLDLCNQKDVLQIESEDFENFGKKSVPLKECIRRENFSECGKLKFSSDKILKFSKSRKSFCVKAKKTLKRTMKTENFEKIFKSNVLKQFEEYSFSKKYSMLKRINSKMKLLKISVLEKINAKMKKGKKQEKFGWKKRKIKGRFFHGVRSRLSLKDMITLIRASLKFRNFLKDKDRKRLDMKPKKNLQFVSVTKQVIQTSQMAMLFIENSRIPIKNRKFKTGLGDLVPHTLNRTTD